MPASEFDQEWDRRISAIRKRAAKALPEDADVIYSAYEEDDKRLPVDNLDKVAVEGRCVFMQECDPYFGKGKNCVSGEYLNPTWIQVCWVANEMIQVTGDRHHIFFEGIHVMREHNGVKLVDLDMGS